jgi:hypothetical protein
MNRSYIFSPPGPFVACSGTALAVREVLEPKHKGGHDYYAFTYALKFSEQYAMNRAKNEYIKSCNFSLLIVQSEPFQKLMSTHV